jgi:conjugal transfer ATP-binding protein TraC
MLDKQIMQGTARIKDIIAPDGIEIYQTEFKQGSKYGRTLVLSAYCRKTYLGWLDEVLNLGDIDYSVHVEPVPDRMVIDQLTKKIATLEAQYMIDQEKGNIYHIPQLRQAIQDLEGIRDAIYSNRDRMFFLTATFTIYAKTLSQLDYLTNNLKSLLARRASKARTMQFIQDKALKTSLPFGNNELNIYRNATLGGVVSMMPFTGFEYSHSSGILLGVNYFSRTPIFYNSFIGAPELANPHAIYIGWSGSGKTVFISTKALRSALHMIKSVLIDPEEGHIAAWVKRAGGTVIEIDPSKPPMINLMEIDVEEDPETGPRINILDKIAEIRSIFGLVVERQAGQGLTAEEIVAIEEAVRETYSNFGINSDPRSLYENDPGQLSISGRKKQLPTISDLQKALEGKYKAERIATLVKPMLYGGSLGMFDGQSTVRLQDELLVCFDIHRIKDEFTRLYAMSVILGWVWATFTQKQPHIRKDVYVDEGWMFARHKDTAEHLEQLGRRARKYKTGLNIASQSFSEFTRSEQGKAVLGSCATSIILKPHPSQINDVQEIYHLSEGAKEFVENAPTGSGLLITEKNVVPIYNQLIPAELEILGLGG